MKIGDEVYVHGFVDEIRKDTVIIRNEGGYFGTDKGEIVSGELRTKQDVKDAAERVLEIIDDADKKAGDKTYIVLDDGSFYSQVKYIKEKMLELKGGEQK